MEKDRAVTEPVGMSSKNSPAVQSYHLWSKHRVSKALVSTSSKTGDL